MNIYIGDFWVPFPSSEYGGMWTVIAKDEAQCVKLLSKIAWFDEYDHLIPDAVQKAKVFQLDENNASNQEARIIENFFT
jgi:hypothetical protein